MRSDLVVHGSFPKRLFLFMLGLRLFDVFLIQSSYVPDEYWQSLEIAHKKVFGYGFETWEWQKGIRSYLYVLLVSGLYSVLKFLQLDSVELVILVPRVFQAILSALADVYFVRWVHEKRSGQFSWAFLSWLSCFFISYCSSRTLINTVEMNLTTIALYYFPWSPKSKSTVFISIIALLTFLRPTSLLTWAPLVLVNLKCVKDPVNYLMTRYLPIFVVVGAVSVLVDSYFHGSLIVTPFNFFKMNILENIGSHYGTHDIFWYFYCGIPVVLGLHTIPFIIGTVQSSNRIRGKRRIFFDIEVQMLVTIIWNVVILSLVPHKEFRFILPLLPMMLYISSGVLSRWSASAKPFFLWFVAVSLVITNFGALAFLGRFHNVGTLETSSQLSAISKNTAVKFLYLTPCHTLPGYSHVHSNVPIEYLTCLPNFNNITNYKDEADRFFDDPRLFLRSKYASALPCSLPTHIVMFNSLNITNFLHMNNYSLFKQLFNSYKYPGWTSEYINIYSRRGDVC